MRSKHWNAECNAKLREYWSCCYLRELAEILGCSVNTIRDHAAKLGLTLADKSTYYKDKLTETNRQAAFKAGKRPPYHISRRKHTDEDKRRIGEKRKALYAAERRRAMYGLPQRTKIKVKY